jgi:hypothetical protein
MKYKFHDSERTRDPEDDWRVRIWLASVPDETGLIVQAMMGKHLPRIIRFGVTCDIDKDGNVGTLIYLPGKVPTWKNIGSTIAVRDALRTLADHCRLTDSERLAMFDLFQKWVRKDFRAVSTL